MQVHNPTKFKFIQRLFSLKTSTFLFMQDHKEGIQ